MVLRYTLWAKAGEKPAKGQKPAVNITRTGGMTRCGRIFASTPPPEKDDLGAVAKNKGKQVVNLEQGQALLQCKSTSDDV